MGRLQSDWYLTKPEASMQGRVTLTKYNALHACKMSECMLCLLQGLPLPLEAVSVIRKSFDARAKHRGFAYVVDIDPEAARAAGASPRFKSGQLER